MSGTTTTFTETPRPVILDLMDLANAWVLEAARFVVSPQGTEGPVLLARTAFYHALDEALRAARPPRGEADA